MIAAGLGQAVDAGVDTMSSYGKQAAVGTVDQIAQTVQDTMSAKVQEMAGLMSQAQQLTTEMTAMINNINGMIEQIGGVDELKNALAGLQQLPEGLKDLKEGTDQLAAGTAAMNAGLDKLNGASGDITDAINKFKDATQELAEKTGELNDGVDEFSREGIDELSGKVTDAMDDLNDVLDTAKAALDQSKEYRSYAGAADTMETSVKFIMKTVSYTHLDVYKRQVYENLMINVPPVSDKMRARLAYILTQAAGCTLETAQARLTECNYQIKPALIMELKHVSRCEAEALLSDCLLYTSRCV